MTGVSTAPAVLFPAPCYTWERPWLRNPFVVRVKLWGATDPAITCLAGTQPMGHLGGAEAGPIVLRPRLKSTATPDHLHLLASSTC